MHVQATAAAEAQRRNLRGQRVAAQGDVDVFCRVAMSPDGQVFATCGRDFDYVSG